MILSYYRRGAGGRAACVRFASGGLGGRQMLLDFEEDQLCVVREIRRNGSIGGRRLQAVGRVWPSGGPGGADLVEPGPEQDRPEDCA
jgi:hypothetical protein